ncbi:MAG: type IV toxin-antitoxin system AbiEi family antitoxin domain-containing protein [Actinomycetes bacterium]
MLRHGLPPAALTRGVFTRAEAEAIGWTDKSIRHRVRTGEWLELHRSAFIDAEAWSASSRKQQHRHLAIGHALGRRVVVGGPSAACVHGFATLSLPASPYLIRAADIPVEDVTWVVGVAVTTPARTVIDCARHGGVEAGVVVADSALHRAAVGLVDLAAMLVKGRTWTHIPYAVEAVASADARAESPLESISRLRLPRPGVPVPRVQELIVVGLGECYRVDFYWPQFRTIGEADGMVKYDTVAALQTEKRRELALHDAGFEVVRWTWREIWDRPEAVAERVRRTFARATTRFGL